MRDEIEAMLRRVGGDEMVGDWTQVHAATPVAPLPSASLDALSVGYAIALGGLAAVVDVAMDSAFRADMAERHRLFGPEEQAAREKAVSQRLKDLGVYPDDQQPKMAMDWYQGLNDDLGLRSPYRLRPSNHRILNHTDERTVIEMLVQGEAGFGSLRHKLYPGMTEAAARELYNLHLAADRSSPASLPLRGMAWLWEQCVRAGDPTKLGSPNPLFSLLSGVAPNIDWSSWFNAFFKADLVPQGASIGEAMLKLYDSGAVNQRTFWTSNLGAAAGGAKRRAIIAGALELGVEVFALLEGVRRGFVAWDGDLKQFAREYLEWRDQPKYLNMRIAAQATASAGAATRAMYRGDALALNYASMALVAKHIWTRPAVGRRHTERLVRHSQADSGEAVGDFQSRTGIRIEPPLTVVPGGKEMGKSLDARLIATGCQSTRVRVLAQRLPDEMVSVVSRYEVLAKVSAGDDAKEAAYDGICESWYLSDEEDDVKALARLKTDLRRVERSVGVP